MIEVEENQWDMYVTHCTNQQAELLESLLDEVTGHETAAMTPSRWFYYLLDKRHAQLLADAKSSALRRDPGCFSTIETETLVDGAENMADWLNHAGSDPLPSEKMSNIWGPADTRFFWATFSEKTAAESVAVAARTTGSPCYLYRPRDLMLGVADGWSRFTLLKTLRASQAETAWGRSVIEKWDARLYEWLRAYDWTDDEDKWGSPFDLGAKGYEYFSPCKLVTPARGGHRRYRCACAATQ